MRSPFTRASGYFAEGSAGLLGLFGAQDFAGTTAPLLNIPSLSIETLQGLLTMALQLFIGIITAYRMLKPKSVSIVARENLPGLTDQPLALPTPEIPAPIPPPLATPPFVSNPLKK